MRKKIALVLGLLFLAGALIQVDALHEIRDTPNKWCGAGPPYTGTLWHGRIYGLPFPWIELSTWEKCTTGYRWEYKIYWAGLQVNVMIFAGVYYLLMKGGRKPS